MIVGAGGHGSVVADAARCAGLWSAISFYDDRWPTLRTHAGCEVVGDMSQLHTELSLASHPGREVVVAVGDNGVRMELSRRFAAAGATLATVVHPSAVVSASSTLGAGSVVFARAVINPGCVVGVSCIVTTGAVIDHDTVLAEGVHICPGAVLAGNVTVGERSWVGIGSSVIQGLYIGERAVIGAGSAVIRNVDPGTTVAGNPARRIQHVSQP